MRTEQSRVLVAGAGCIGTWLGAKLQAKGVVVHYLGRQATQERLANGLKISGLGEAISLETLEVVTHSERVYDWVILACKRQDTQALISRLGLVLTRKPTLIVAQNGLGAAQRAADVSGCSALPIMVPFNVHWLAPGHLHQATGGRVVVPRELGVFASAWDADTTTDIDSVLAGKLLLNLNNAINGLCGLPLAQELSQQPFRQVLAAAQQEALKVFKAKGIKPAKMLGTPPALLPYILRLPDKAFSRLAKGMLAMDVEARSSLYDDLAAGKETEIAYLNGWVVREADALGLAAPVNRHLLQLVQDAEQKGAVPGLDAGQLLPLKKPA
ncbi:2-dehydropantoate 2-reductase [Gallaecimonas mangrovi]|uniref:2-dehydropantoate 2-reductase n=1 Tax=Gallaecimonas mangrovi TaxID=2291597 RepID=UPI0018671147|nr:2-dehydropantoate 2-reductase [Gallaecimonas mangrovi]